MVYTVHTVYRVPRQVYTMIAMLRFLHNPYRSVKLEEQVVGVAVPAKLHVNDSVNAQLPDVFQTPGAEVLAQLEGEVAGCVAFGGRSLCVCVCRYFCTPCATAS